MISSAQLIAIVDKVWTVPIPRYGSDKKLEATLKGYRNYAVIAVFFLILVARAVPSGGSGIASALISSAAAAILVGFLDFIFGEKGVLLQFSWLVTTLVQLFLFIVIDNLFSWNSFYMEIARSTDWHIPGLVSSGIITLAALLIKNAARRGKLEFRAIAQAALIVLGSTAFLAIVFAIDDNTLKGLLDLFPSGDEG